MSILPPFLFDGPEDADTTFAFAHGADVGMESDFIPCTRLKLMARRVAPEGHVSNIAKTPLTRRRL